MFTMIAAALAGGCTPVMRVEDMVPVPAGKSTVTLDKSISVAPVHGGTPSESAMQVIANVENADFREATVRALRNSGIFREVSSAEKGELLLDARIISQQAAGPRSGVYTLLVHYELHDGATGKILWRGNVYSDALAHDFPHGQLDTSWLPRVRGHTVQENLSQLIESLSASLHRKIE
jgi:hypothetical protein